MKKTISVLLVSLLTAAIVCLIGTGASAASEAEFRAPYGTPVIDGVLDDIWKNVEAQPVDNVDKQVIPSSSETTGTLRVMWDEENLYIYVEVDKHGVQVFLGEEGTALNENNSDCVELNFSLSGNFNENDLPGTQHDDIGDIIVYPDGSKTGFGKYFDYYADFVDGAMIVTDTDKYVAEYALPWRGVDVWTDHICSLEIQINDHSQPQRDGLINWASEVGCWGWQRTTDHGKVILVENSSGQPGERPVVTEPTVSTEKSEIPTETPPATSEAPATTPESEALTEKPVDTEKKNEEPAKKNNTGLIIGIAAAAVVIAVVAALLIKKAKNK